MEIRKSTNADAERIMDIFESAKAYMRSHGNTSQLGGGYPSGDILSRDIENGNSYVITVDGEAVGTFSFIIGDDPTYAVIKDGHWRYDKPYGTIHRLASCGSAHGIARACFDYCADVIDYLRIDTHEVNLTMRSAIEKYGFARCGIIYVRDGTERIAYDYLKE